MELWDTYDKYRNKTGRTVERGMHQMMPGDYHLVVHICIFNSKGELLIQQRQPFKEGWSDMWDITVGGSSVAGETSIEAAEREVYEEIGYKLNLDGVLPSLTINGDNWFDDIYIIQCDIDPACLKLQYEEVKQVRWADREEISQMIESGSFLPYHKSFINLLFDMQGGRGVLNRKRLT